MKVMLCCVWRSFVVERKNDGVGWWLKESHSSAMRSLDGVGEFRELSQKTRHLPNLLSPLSLTLVLSTFSNSALAFFSSFNLAAQ